MSEEKVIGTVQSKTSDSNTTTVIESPRFQIANQGYVIPRAQANIISRFDPTRTVRRRYTSSDVPIYDIDEIPQSFHDQVRLCWDYYISEPIVGTVIDIMTQFTFGDVQHIAENEDVKNFFDDLYEEAGLAQVLKWVAFEYYLIGNSFPYRTRYDEIVRAKSGREIPKYRWTVLNPEFVHIEGSMLFDNTVITLKPNQELIDLVKNRKNNTVLRKLFESLPSSIIKDIENGNNILLDQDRVAHIYRNKQPYQRYATPFLMRALTPLRIKEKLLQMDLSTADGIINQLVTVTVGNDMYPATQEDLDNVAKLLDTPNKALTLLWNHTLNVKFHRPEVEVFDPKKYTQVNRDIQLAMGIDMSFIDGQKNSYGGHWMSINTLIERLEWGRKDIQSWLESEYRKIAEENDLPSYPKIKFSKINLREDRTVKNILMQLYDRGIISAETVIEQTDHEFAVEIDRLEKENELRQKGLFVSRSPYQQSQDGPGRPDGAEDQEPRERTPDVDPHGAG